MTDQTIEFLIVLCDWYAETSSGKEPENTEAVAKAYQELLSLSADNDNHQSYEKHEEIDDKTGETILWRDDCSTNI